MNNSTRFERAALLTLSVMLVSVFLLSVNMYDRISEETNSGVLAVFAKETRDFVFANDAVAAFLGIEKESVNTYASIDIAEEAAAYIERYNKAYENNN